MSCQICGAGLPAGAMFCGECGSSTRATPTSRRRPDPRPSDTTIIQPLAPAPSVVSVAIPVHPAVTAGAPLGTAAPKPAAAVAPGVPATPDAPNAPVAAVAPVAPTAPAGQPAAAVETRRSRSGRHAKPPEPAPTPGPAVQAAAVPASASGLAGPAAAVPAPTASAAPPHSSFVLQFSTGETVAVQGSGLVGRRPLPQPAEHFDHLIQIADVGMSVSKSHLEFGQYDGELWISDRYSGNGTIIRRPGEGALRCEPGRRYLVPRGSRVEVADQFFVVN